MKQLPNNFKYKRIHRSNYFNSNLNINSKNHINTHLSLGIIVLKECRLSYNQILAVVKQLKKKLAKKINIFVTIAFNKPYTSKAISVRMGKGKGQQRKWYSYVKKGQCIIEVGLRKKKDFFLYKSVLKKTLTKLPVKSTYFINSF